MMAARLTWISVSNASHLPPIDGSFRGQLPRPRPPAFTFAAATVWPAWAPLAKAFPGGNQTRRGFNPRPEVGAAVASVAVVAAASAASGRWVRR
jgi:hypothetical protein